MIDTPDQLMQDQRQPLAIFSVDEAGVPLRCVEETLRSADCPVSISVDIAGPATAEQLDSAEWETAFVRWESPELHDVYFLERDVVGTGDDADQVLASALKTAIAIRIESAGRLIVLNHLRRAKTVYGVHVLPALLADEDHPAWSALDIALRTFAADGCGIIFAVGEGFFDEDGEPLLVVDEMDELVEIDDIEDMERVEIDSPERRNRDRHK